MEGKLLRRQLCNVYKFVLSHCMGKSNANNLYHLDHYSTEGILLYIGIEPIGNIMSLSTISVMNSIKRGLLTL